MANTSKSSVIISKAVGWSDGGNEFVFNDGVVMAFANFMESVTICDTSAENSPADLVITSLCLAKHKRHVAAALAMYNSVSPNPRLVKDLLLEDQAVLPWTSTSPRDALILSNSPLLYSLSEFEVRLGNVERVAIPRLSCALKHVTLTLLPNNVFFSVRWPAMVADSQGSKHYFVPSEQTHALVQKVERYTMIEQLFLVAEPPVHWAKMLEIALCHYKAESSGANTLVSQSLPETLAFGPGAHIANSVKFPQLALEDSHALVASNDIQNLSVVKKLHPAAVCNWRYDCSQQNQKIIYFVRMRSDVSVDVLVTEDLSSLNFKLIDFETKCTSATHMRLDGTSEYFCENNLPTSSRSVPKLEILKFVDSLKDAHIIPSYLASDIPFSSRTMPNRYWQSVVHTCSQLVSNRPALSPQILSSESLIRCSSCVPGVGMFNALYDGSIRAVFDDRAIVTLAPNADIGWVAHLLTPDANQHTSRVVHCNMASLIYPYLQYLISFQNFANLNTNEHFQSISFPNGQSLVSPIDHLLLQTREKLMAAANCSLDSQSMLKHTK